MDENDYGSRPLHVVKSQISKMEVCRAQTEWPLATGWRFRACRVLSEASKCRGFRAWRRGSWVVMTSVFFFSTAQ